MEQKGLNIAEIPQTAIRVLTSPASFYREMPKAGGFVEPLVFAVVMGVNGGLIQAVLNIAGLRIGAGIAAGFYAIVYVPIAVAIFGFIGAAILFVIWKLMGSQESYETAYRVRRIRERGHADHHGPRRHPVSRRPARDPDRHVLHRDCRHRTWEQMPVNSKSCSEDNLENF